MFQIVRRLAILKGPLPNLHRQHFTGLNEHVAAARNLLEFQQQQLRGHYSDVEKARVEAMRTTLTELIEAEETSLRQRTKSDWIKLTDRGTNGDGRKEAG
ncbi:hypothetical protein Dimus_001986 [Dionaea muscipula]